MAGFAIRLDIQDGPARAIVVDLRQRGENTTPVMKIIGEIGRTSIIKNFESEGRPTPWKKSKRALKSGGKTLTKSRRLANSITSKAGRDSVDIGTNVIYARIHNLGGDIKSPARDRIMHFRRGTVDQFANQDDANRHLHMPNGQKLHFLRNAGAGFWGANKKAHFAMKVAGKAYTITMPQREFMLLQPEDWTEIQAALVEYLAGKQ